MSIQYLPSIGGLDAISVVTINGTANGLSIDSSQVLTLALSSTSTVGALSATDWNTFNGKQAAGNYITALTGDVAASGPGSAAATIQSGVIVNSMVNTSAAIAYSKLALTGSIVNADINTSAAIAYSKLALTGSIVNADVNASAAIALTKLAALSSHSRALVSDSSGFITEATTTSTEIGYVNGVTSAIQPQIDGKQASGNYITALTGDATASGPGSVALTLATVNANVGSFGSSTAIPAITVTGKGLITAISTSAVIAPAGTLTGTTLNSTVVTSSLTSVGTIATGTWQGTTIAIDHGGSGQVTANAALNAFLPSQTGNSGKYLGTDGSNTSWSTVSAAAANSYQEFTSSGSWVAPAGVTQARFKYCGGGGGGASGGNNTTAGNAKGGGGGGAGAYVIETTVPVTPGATYTITIGIAGPGGNAATTNNNGNNGTVGGDTTIVGTGVSLKGFGGGPGLGGGQSAGNGAASPPGEGWFGNTAAGVASGGGGGSGFYLGPASSAAAPGTSYFQTGGRGGANTQNGASGGYSPWNQGTPAAGGTSSGNCGGGGGGGGAIDIGGSGGNANNASNAGGGNNGSKGSGGGGGGAAQTTATTSGAGGNGGAGYVLVSWIA